MTHLVANTTFNAKTNEVKNKVPSTANFQKILSVKYTFSMMEHDFT